MTPNVEAAALPAEIAALHERYAQVKQFCAQVWHIIVDFQEHVEEMAGITINLAFDTVYRLVIQGQLYKNYYELHHEGVKKYDRDREMTDNCLFGEERGHCIRYGALCSRLTGLHSYGEFCIVLNSNELQEYTSVFEENPFVFLKKHPYTPKQEPCIPYGYRATWENRSKLAVAKLGERITADTQPSDFPSLLTHCSEDKMQDDFIEVHICKKINCDDIVEVRAPGEYSQVDENEDEFDFVATQIQVIQKKLENLGKTWTTYN
jgi:hypothetical protein